MKKPLMIIVSMATTLLLSDLTELQGAQPFGPTQWSSAQQLPQGPAFRTASQVDPAYSAGSYTTQNAVMGFQPNDVCGRCRNAWAGYCAEKSAACARRACHGHGCGRCGPTVEPESACGCPSCAEPCCRHAGCGLGVLRFFGLWSHTECACEYGCGDACSTDSDASYADTDAEATDILVAPEMPAPPAN